MDAAAEPLNLKVNHSFMLQPLFLLMLPVPGKQVHAMDPSVLHHHSHCLYPYYLEPASRDSRDPGQLASMKQLLCESGLRGDATARADRSCRECTWVHNFLAALETTTQGVYIQNEVHISDSRS